MAKSTELTVGKFYWVRPDYDVDDERSFEEQIKPEPARFTGLNEDNSETWDMLGTENWGVAFVLGECVVPEEFIDE